MWSSLMLRKQPAICDGNAALASRRWLSDREADLGCPQSQQHVDLRTLLAS
jgi:hypothetical protein